MSGPGGRGAAGGALGRGIRVGALIDASGDPGATAAMAASLAARGHESLQLSFWQSIGELDLGELAAALGAALEGSGCSPSALGVYGNPLSGDEAGAETLRSLEALIEAAPAFGAPLVSSFAGRLPGASVPDSIPAFAATFGRLCDLAQRRGLALALENCRLGDSWKTGKWNIAINPEAWELIFAAMPGAPLGLEWEPAHQVLALADPLLQLREWSPRILHVHAKDARLDRAALARKGLHGPGRLGREVLPGEGDTDWTAVFAVLGEAGWSGAIDVELGAMPEWQGEKAAEGLERGFRALAEARDREGATP